MPLLGRYPLPLLGRIGSLSIAIAGQGSRYPLPPQKPQDPVFGAAAREAATVPDQVLCSQKLIGGFSFDAAI